MQSLSTWMSLEILILFKIIFLLRQYLLPSFLRCAVRMQIGIMTRTAGYSQGKG